MRLMSASIDATAVVTAVRAAISPRMAAERPAIPSLTFERLIDEGGGEEREEAEPRTQRRGPGSDFPRSPVPDQLLARDDQRADGVSRQRLHVHGLEEPVRARCASPRASLRSVLWVASDFSAW